MILYILINIFIIKAQISRDGFANILIILLKFNETEQTIPQFLSQMLATGFLLIHRKLKDLKYLISDIFIKLHELL